MRNKAYPTCDELLEQLSQQKNQPAPTACCRLCGGLNGEHAPGCRLAPSPEAGQPLRDSLYITIPALLCHKKAKCADGQTRKVPGPPTIPKLVGYYTNGKTPNFDRAREYSDWKDHVAKCAPASLPVATRERPVRLDVWCYFPGGTHGDPENVRKGIVDALFKHRAGGDKYVYGYHHYPQYDREQPRVEVVIT